MTAMKRFADFVASVFQRDTEESADGFLIINDEYAAMGVSP